MAKYFGHFIKGIGMGIPTGIKIAEMRWQKKERERIQKEKDEVMASASAFNKKLEEFYADKELSKDERLQLDTIYMTSGYNVQELIKGSYEAVVKLDKETEERNLALLKSYREAWGDFDLDLSTIPELYEYYKGQTIGEKSKQIFDAGDRLLQKQYEAKQKVVPEISITERKYNWAIENYKAGKISFDELSKYMGAYIAPEEMSAKEKEIELIKEYGGTNEEIKNKLLGITAPKPPTPIAFKTLQDIKDSFKNVTTRAKYDEALASYNASKEAKASDWTPPEWEPHLTGLIKKIEEAFWVDFVDKESGKLKDRAGIDPDTKWSNSELYNKRVQQYLALIEEARNAGIGVNQFQAFIPYKELYWGRGNPLVISESW